jgi:hypothetical protein
MMRAAVFVRYHSGEGFGHVGWAFDDGTGCVYAGSVENHSGHIFTPATKMGFWCARAGDPVAEMRKRGYDDLKWIEIPGGDPQLAYRTMLWIEREAYKVLHRNCEDDVYDVLRAFGIEDLAYPTIVWFPKSWFKRFRGTLEHVGQYEWAQTIDGERTRHGEPVEPHAEPWQPTWRRPWHPHFHALQFGRLSSLLHK